MNGTYTHQKPAGVIRYSCGILFLLFSFCYLYFLQGEILAEAQFVYSKGVTTYNLLVGAIIIPLVLQIVQWIVAMASRLPARWHALSYLPSMLMLAILTGVNQATLMHFSFGAWTWIAPLVLLAYVLLVILVRRVDTNGNAVAQDLRVQLYPNYIILFLLMLVVGGIPKSSDVYHYELKAERLILQKDYAAACEVGERSLRSSARLTQLRMYALSKQGLLAERLFEYPQHYGSRGLLDVTDTLSSYRFSPQSICSHLGAFCGSSIHDAKRYYALMLGDSLWNRHTADYYLCSLLLYKDLKAFRQQLPRYYDLSDSIPQAFSRLPKAYREALLLTETSGGVSQGKVRLGKNSLTISDTELLQQFKDYRATKAEFADPTERINKTHRLFGKTYWWYYDFSHLAEGELKVRGEGSGER